MKLGQHRRTTLACALIALALASVAARANPPAPPSNVTAVDHPLDHGDQVDVSWDLSPDDATSVSEYKVYWRRVLSTDDRQRAEELAETVRAASKWAGKCDADAKLDYDKALADELAKMAPDTPSEAGSVPNGEKTFMVEKLEHGGTYTFEVAAIGKNKESSALVQAAQTIVATRELFDGGRFSLFIITAIICGSVISFILLARSGRPLKIRKIAGLEAVDEAVGRATEMGRPVLFIPGIQDMNDIQTIAGLTVLARVAKTVAEYDAKLEVPTSKSLVMTAARETVQNAFLTAGRPDAYNQDLIYYVTDEQFGYVAYLTGHMGRQKPAACFYMGAFFAESLILAETGNKIGAIQIAGTAEPSQLPFFVAACDYTLIGEEFFAASAYLSGEPDQLGSLKGQDVGKLIVAAGLVVGCIIATCASLAGSDSWFGHALHFLKHSVLT